jgi:hypothetical protein
MARARPWPVELQNVNARRDAGPHTDEIKTANGKAVGSFCCFQKLDGRSPTAYC